ncbi:MAG: dethiobiotin synthase [Planctomycetota bacterium]
MAADFTAQHGPENSQPLEAAIRYRWPTRGLFITGTDTDVGKTFVGAIIVRSLTRQGYRVGVYKPVASGCEIVGGELQSADARALWEAAGRPLSLGDVCPQRFAAPLAPNLAAAAEGRSVDPKVLRSGLENWTDHCEMVVVEGAGGLFSPISQSDFVLDLACELAYPVIIVAANRLGTINATILSIQAAERAGLRIAGVVLNTTERRPSDPSQASNAAELARCLQLLKSPVRLLGTVDQGAEQLDTLPSQSDSRYSWDQLVGSRLTAAEKRL